MGERVRSGYASDVTDEEWSFVAPYLALCREDAAQRDYPLRDVFNSLRYIAKTGNQWRFMPNDLPPWTVVYQQMRRWIDARCFEITVEDPRILLREFAVDTLGHLLALHVTATDEQDRVQVERLAEAVQEITGDTIELAYVDQGYTGDNAAQAAEKHGVRLEVVKHTEAKRGFVLLPRRWVVERSFAWAARFRRLARDYERLSKTLAGLHYLAFAILMLANLVRQLTQC